MQNRNAPDSTYEPIFDGGMSPLFIMYFWSFHDECLYSSVLYEYNWI